MRSKSRRCLVIDKHQVSWILTFLFLSKGKHRMHNSSIGSLYNTYFMYIIVHLRSGFWWNLAALGLFPLHEYLVYPHDGLER
jgi:hypothetical protein